VSHHPFLFPSEVKLCDNAARAIAWTKQQRMADKMSLRALQAKCTASQGHNI